MPEHSLEKHGMDRLRLLLIYISSVNPKWKDVQPYFDLLEKRYKNLDIEFVKEIWQRKNPDEKLDNSRNEEGTSILNGLLKRGIQGVNSLIQQENVKGEVS